MGFFRIVAAVMCVFTAAAAVAAPAVLVLEREQIATAAVGVIVPVGEWVTQPVQRAVLDQLDQLTPAESVGGDAPRTPRH